MGIKQWEYCRQETLTECEEQETKWLNELGQDGWELVEISRHGIDPSCCETDDDGRVVLKWCVSGLFKR
jgi:hypothetical protein